VPPKIWTVGLLNTDVEVITPHAVSAKEVPSMADALTLERQLKRKKNPQLAISASNSTKNLNQ
jgi:hypothetical protein